jgi:hypothetical protein
VRNANITIPSITVLGLAACLSCAAGQARRPYRNWDGLGACSAAESGAVSCGNQVIAVIRCEPRSATGCRSLSVRYADDGTVVWVYGNERSAETSSTERKADFDRADDVVIARDGSALWFHHRTVWSKPGSWEMYDLKGEHASDVGNNDVWKIWALLQEGRALWLGGAQPGRSVIRW